MDAELYEQSKRLLSAQGIANELGVTERTVRRWVEAGRLDASKYGRAYQIDLDDARRVVAQNSGRRRPDRDWRLDELQDAYEARMAEISELRGRYQELSEQIVRLREELSSERRKAVRLELFLEQQAA